MMDWILRQFGYVSVYKINRKYGEEMVNLKNDKDSIYFNGFSFLLKNKGTIENEEYAKNLKEQETKLEDTSLIITNFKNIIL